jgi:cell division protein FtsL
MRILLLLVLVAMVSALAVVDMKYRTRLLFSEMQRLQTLNEAFDEDLARLQFEQNKWAERDRIEKEARTRLHMVLPGPESILSIKP